MGSNKKRKAKRQNQGPSGATILRCWALDDMDTLMAAVTNYWVTKQNRQVCMQDIINGAEALIVDLEDKLHGKVRKYGMNLRQMQEKLKHEILEKEYGTTRLPIDSATSARLSYNGDVDTEDC